MKAIENYKTTISKLHNSEHGLAAKAIKEAYDAKLPAVGDPILTAYHQKYIAKVLKEEEMLKSILASELTPRMEYVNHERSFAISIIDRVVANAADSTFELDRKEAGLKLRPITRAYHGLTTETRASETSDLFNILEDFNTTENAAALATLSLTPFITRAGALNQQYFDLLGERELEWQHTHHGSLLPIRLELDSVLQDLVEATNLHYGIAPTPALEATIDAVNAAIQPFRRIVARRHKHSAPPSSGAGDGEHIDEGTQTPDTTNPPAPDTPPQAPDTTNPPAPDTPPQNPVATPPPINPEDLNPPAAGE
jgi:hypothetical protein